MSERKSDSYPPRLNAKLAEQFSGQNQGALKRLRKARAIRFFRTGHRTIVYDRDSLAAWLAKRCIEPLGGAE
jgi:hypothetical protein